MSILDPISPNIPQPTDDGTVIIQPDPLLGESGADETPAGSNASAFPTYISWLTHLDNRVTSAVVAATSESGVYPASRLKTLPVSATWRATNSADTQDLTVDFGAAAAIDIVALVNHNLSDGATITIAAGTDTSYGSFSESMTWREFIAFKWLTTQQSYRYWRVRISDAANTDGYIEVGYLMIGAFTHPEFTFRQGWRSTPEFGTSQVLTEFGTMYTEEMYRRQTLELSFGPISTANMAILRDLYTDVKRNVYPVLILPERNGAEAYFGRIANLFEERVELWRFADIRFVEESLGRSIGA